MKSISRRDQAEAGRRGNSQLQVVSQSYRIDRSVVVAGQPEVDFYLPQSRPMVVSELAKIRVADPDSALSFVSRWGLLGYAKIMDRRHIQPIPSGDPLVWLWAHANGVRAIMRLQSLIEAEEDDRVFEIELRSLAPRVSLRTVNRRLSQGDIADLSFGRRGAQVEPISRKKWGYVVSLPLHGRRESIGESLIAGDSLKAIAERIIQTIINENLVGISPQLVSTGEEGVAINFSWDCLASVIYLHLAETVANGRIGQCKYCGSFFSATDRRQQFCPPREPHTSASYCGTMARSQRFLERKVNRGK